MVDYTLGTVISSRIRLARNINGYPFPARLKSDSQAKAIIRSVTSAVNKVDEFQLHYMDAISEDKALNLVENRLISPALLNRPSQSAALINKAGDITIMINEEDHLREQCISDGLSLRPAYKRLSEKDSLIARALPFAYDERLGYLTACPTNLGTGLRASVMMFLPALQLGGLMQQKMMGIIDDLGLTVRGAYGEGSKAEGYTFQISNEVTLGITEEFILSQVEKAVGMIVEAEASERHRLRSGGDGAVIKDKCLRAYGILTNCVLLTHDELDELCADIKLAACMGYLKINDLAAIDELTSKMKPSNVNLAAGRKLSDRETEEYCAQYVSNRIKSLVIKA